MKTLPELINIWKISGGIPFIHHESTNKENYYFPDYLVEVCIDAIGINV